MIVGTISGSRGACARKERLGVCRELCFFAKALPVGGEKGGASSLLSEALTGVQHR
jgi:hypothetical protein